QAQRGPPESLLLEDGPLHKPVHAYLQVRRRRREDVCRERRAAHMAGLVSLYQVGHLINCHPYAACYERVVEGFRERGRRRDDPELAQPGGARADDAQPYAAPTHYFLFCRQIVIAAGHLDLVVE